jgi:hypothetical protein
VYGIRIKGKPSASEAAVRGVEVISHNPIIMFMGGQTTKLGLAAMLSYPLEGLDYDIVGIQNMGYKDIHDVGQRVVTANSVAGEYLHAVPLTFEPSSHDQDGVLDILDRQEEGDDRGY